MAAQAVLPELVELRRAEESGPIEVEELIRDALAEHQDVISVDGDLHPGVAELADWMLRQGFDSPKQHIGGGADVDADAIELHHGCRLGCRNLVLHLVELQLLRS